MGKLFVVHLKKNLGKFACHDFVSALAIFDPRKVLSADSAQLPIYGKNSIEVLFNHYGKDKPALTLNEKETVKSAVINPGVQNEWITFRTLLASKHGDNIALQLKELIQMKGWSQCYQTCK